VAGEKLGIPSIGVMTTKFVSAADLMSRVLGADGFSFVTIDHPISSAKPDKLSNCARQAAVTGAEILVGGA
tara:strand:- start:37 stop:249 length:213 start_codon:yes stop_codon:yes gene_type:complete